jgi:hypothetical protein
MKLIVAILLLAVSSPCPCESDNKGKTHAQAQAELWSSWIAELEKGSMRLFYPTSGSTVLSVLKPNLSPGESDTVPVLLNIFIESDSVKASSDSYKALINLLKSGKPQPVPLIPTHGAFTIKNEANEVAFHVEYFNETETFGQAGVMVWRASCAGVIELKQFKSPIELYQTCPGLDFMAVFISQSQLDTFIKMAKSPPVKAK